ncbi:hypothetical protein HDU91_000428, partial [Kappamyces sp. JEL0680]
GSKKTAKLAANEPQAEMLQEAPTIAVYSAEQTLDWTQDPTQDGLLQSPKPPSVVSFISDDDEQDYIIHATSASSPGTFELPVTVVDHQQRDLHKLNKDLMRSLSLSSIKSVDRENVELVQIDIQMTRAEEDSSGLAYKIASRLQVDMVQDDDTRLDEEAFQERLEGEIVKGHGKFYKDTLGTSDTTVEPRDSASTLSSADHGKDALTDMNEMIDDVDSMIQAMEKGGTEQDSVTSPFSYSSFMDAYRKPSRAGVQPKDGSSAAWFVPGKWASQHQDAAPFSETLESSRLQERLKEKVLAQTATLKSFLTPSAGTAGEQTAATKSKKEIHRPDRLSITTDTSASQASETSTKEDEQIFSPKSIRASQLTELFGSATPVAKYDPQVFPPTPILDDADSPIDIMDALGQLTPTESHQHESDSVTVVVKNASSAPPSLHNVSSHDSIPVLIETGSPPKEPASPAPSTPKANKRQTQSIATSPIRSPSSAASEKDLFALFNALQKVEVSRRQLQDQRFDPSQRGSPKSSLPPQDDPFLPLYKHLARLDHNQMDPDALFNLYEAIETLRSGKRQDEPVVDSNAPIEAAPVEPSPPALFEKLTRSLSMTFRPRTPSTPVPSRRASISGGEKQISTHDSSLTLDGQGADGDSLASSTSGRLAIATEGFASQRAVYPSLMRTQINMDDLKVHSEPEATTKEKKSLVRRMTRKISKVFKPKASQ